MSPRSICPQLNAVNFVVNEFVDQQAFAVVQFGQHRSSLDDDRLGDENAEQNEHADYQKHIAQRAADFRHRDPCRDSTLSR